MAEAVSLDASVRAQIKTPAGQSRQELYNTAFSESATPK